MSNKQCYLPHSNHYQVKNGKVVIKQPTNQTNYRWIPTISQHPTLQNYYQSTLRKLQSQIATLKQLLQSKHNSSHNHSIDNHYVTHLQSTIQHLQNMLKQKENQLQLKQSQLTTRQSQIMQRQQEIKRMKDQLDHKDNLIKYQLSVVDRLIQQIQQKQIQDQEGQNNDYQLKNKQNYYSSQFTSPQRMPNLLSQQINLPNEVDLYEKQFNQLTARLDIDMDCVQVQCVTPKGQYQKQNLTLASTQSQSKQISQKTPSDITQKISFLDNLKNWEGAYSNSFLIDFIQGSLTQRDSLLEPKGKLNFNYA